MAKKITNSLYSWEINNSYAPPSLLDVKKIIDLTYSSEISSPIDTFIKKNADLNKLLIDSGKVKIKLDTLYRGKRLKKQVYTSIVSYIDNPSNISPVLANLVLLGHLSVVESYFREIFKEVIFMDKYAQQVCRGKMLSYGAAITHKQKDLPDALLEEINFASSFNITESIRDFVGIKGSLPNGITTALGEFSKVCQLRHCIVHRFGKLGVNNAMRLDWDNLKTHLEKPIKIDYVALQEVSQICSTVVKEINNYIWQCLMMRQIASSSDNSNFKKMPIVEWTWIWKKDRHKFTKYYEIFLSTLAPPITNDVRMAYNDYKLKYSTLI